MDNVTFLGRYIIRDLAAIPAMPEHNDCGLWRVWHTEDKRIIVQPLDENYTPFGRAQLLAEENFTRFLVPLPDEDFPPADPLPPSYAEEPGKNFSLGDPLFRPHAEEPDEPADPSLFASDDLLEIWYAQALTAFAGDTKFLGLLPAAGSGPNGPREEPLAAKASPGEGDQEIAGDETRLLPAWDPDDIYLPAEQEQTIPAPNAAAFLPATPGNSGPAAAGRAPSDPLPAGPFPVAAPFDLLPDPGHWEQVSDSGDRTTDQKGQSGAPEGGAFAAAQADSARQAFAAHLERELRREFAALAERLDDRRNPPVEKRIARLLARKEDGFTWKQKFMFTDFGVELRRKHQPRLSLECHLRALELAPNDEHVLFNVARAEFELGDSESAQEHLIRALAVAPSFAAAANFLNFLQGET